MISFNLTVGYPMEGSLLSNDQRLDILHTTWDTIKEIGLPVVYTQWLELYAAKHSVLNVMPDIESYLATQPFIGDDSINFHCSGGGERLFKEQIAHVCCLLLMRTCAKQGVYINLEIN